MKKFLHIYRAVQQPFFWIPALLLAFPASTLAAIDEATEKQIKKATVRVVANGYASSGFIYGPDHNQVITALHTILPRTNDIKITCNRGNEADAEVVAVLRKADLVLLQASENLKDYGCATLEDVRESRPALGEQLIAFGFRPKNSLGVFSQFLVKTSQDPETLMGLVPDTARDDIIALAMPDANLPLYFVNGAIMPGYSGGPVFDMNGNLIGVVQGGLDKGMGDHAWLMPARHIKELMNPALGSSLPSIRPSEFGFSAPAASDTGNNFIEFSFDGVEYTWVKTKTRSFQELYETADPALGLDTLLDSIVPDIETSAQHELTFDIYEEVNLGLIIAVPVGSPLKPEIGEYIWQLKADAQDSDSLMAIPATLKVEHTFDGMTYADQTGEQVSPTDASYFDAYVEYRRKMWGEGEPRRTMKVDQNLSRVIEYQNGNKILRLGYTLESTDSTDSPYIGYHYESLLVKGNEVLEVKTDFDVSADSEVTLCRQEATPAMCGDPYWRQISFLLAAQLSAFSSLGVDEDQIVRN